MTTLDASDAIDQGRRDTTETGTGMQLSHGFSA